MSPEKSSTRRKRTPAKARRSRPRPAPPPPPEEVSLPAPTAVEALAPIVDAVPVELDFLLSSPERVFAERLAPPEPERPRATERRAIFFDVENTSRAQHIAHVIDHLTIDRRGYRTEFFAVGNWRVIGHDTARLLASHGAHLVHSAPSVGVRDWSDLRIAVAAGAWLAVARPGDLIEIVSDDRAFDAVGDVAASMGIAFRRLSYRGLVSAPAEAPPRPMDEQVVEDRRAPSRDGGGGRRYHGGRRGRRGGGSRGGQPAPPQPQHRPEPQRRPEPPRPVPVDEGGEPHTAPHDEIVTVVRELMRAAGGRGLSIDAVANTLKSRGFSRPPGSPRLITRLRRIKEIEVSRNGMITLVGSASVNGAEPVEPSGAEPHDLSGAEPGDLTVVEPVDVQVVDGGDPVEDDVDEINGNVLPPPDVDDAMDDDGPQPGNERTPQAQPSSGGGDASRRRRRRGGRRRRGRGGRQPSSAP